MKKMMLSLALLASVVMYGHAQQRGGGMGRMNPEDRAKRTAENLEKELKLSEAQKDSVYAYTLAQSKEQQSLFQQGGGGDRQAAMAKMKDLQEKTDTKIKAILDDTQKKQYDEYLEKRAERMKNFGGGMGGRRRGGNN